MSAGPPRDASYSALQSRNGVAQFFTASEFEAGLLNVSQLFVQGIPLEEYIQHLVENTQHFPRDMVARNMQQLEYEPTPVAIPFTVERALHHIEPSEDFMSVPKNVEFAQVASRSAHSHVADVAHSYHDPVNGQSGYVLTSDDNGQGSWKALPRPDAVEGPLQSRLNSVAVFDHTNGQLLRDSSITIQGDVLTAPEINTSRLVILQDSKPGTVAIKSVLNTLEWKDVEKLPVIRNLIQQITTLQQQVQQLLSAQKEVQQLTASKEEIVTLQQQVQQLLSAQKEVQQLTASKEEIVTLQQQVQQLLSAQKEVQQLTASKEEIVTLQQQVQQLLSAQKEVQQLTASKEEIVTLQQQVQQLLSAQKEVQQLTAPKEEIVTLQQQVQQLLSAQKEVQQLSAPKEEIATLQQQVQQLLSASKEVQQLATLQQQVQQLLSAQKEVQQVGVLKKEIATLQQQVQQLLSAPRETKTIVIEEINTNNVIAKDVTTRNIIAEDISAQQISVIDLRIPSGAESGSVLTVEAEDGVCVWKKQCLTNGDEKTIPKSIATFHDQGGHYLDSSPIVIQGTSLSTKDTLLLGWNGVNQQLTLGGDATRISAGKGALRSANPSSTSLLALGVNTLANTEIGELLALGDQSQSYNKTGKNNTSLGIFSLEQNEHGHHNTAIGHSALKECKSSANTATGSSALSNLIDGASNTVTGTASGEMIVHGKANVAIGDGAGPSGDYNNTLALGCGAHPVTDGDVALGSVEAPLRLYEHATSGRLFGINPSKYLSTTVNGTAYRLALYDP